MFFFVRTLNFDKAIKVLKFANIKPKYVLKISLSFSKSSNIFKFSKKMTFTSMPCC